MVLDLLERSKNVSLVGTKVDEQPIPPEAAAAPQVFKAGDLITEHIVERIFIHEHEPFPETFVYDVSFARLLHVHAHGSA